MKSEKDFSQAFNSGGREDKQNEAPKETIIGSLKNLWKTMLGTLATLAFETLIVWLIWNYVFEYELTYVKVGLIIAMVRLVLKDVKIKPSK